VGSAVRLTRFLLAAVVVVETPLAVVAVPEV